MKIKSKIIRSKKRTNLTKKSRKSAPTKRRVRRVHRTRRNKRGGSDYLFGIDKAAYGLGSAVGSSAYNVGSAVGSTAYNVGNAAVSAVNPYSYTSDSKPVKPSSSRTASISSRSSSSSIKTVPSTTSTINTIETLDEKENRLRELKQSCQNELNKSMDCTISPECNDGQYVSDILKTKMYIDKNGNEIIVENDITGKKYNYKDKKGNKKYCCNNQNTKDRKVMCNISNKDSESNVDDEINADNVTIRSVDGTKTYKNYDHVKTMYRATPSKLKFNKKQGSTSSSGVFGRTFKWGGKRFK